jgi:hypothetical protein
MSLADQLRGMLASPPALVPTKAAALAEVAQTEADAFAEIRRTVQQFEGLRAKARKFAGFGRAAQQRFAAAHAAFACQLTDEAFAELQAAARNLDDAEAIARRIPGFIADLDTLAPYSALAEESGPFVADELAGYAAKIGEAVRAKIRELEPLERERIARQLGGSSTAPATPPVIVQLNIFADQLARAAHALQSHEDPAQFTRALAGLRALLKAFPEPATA